MHCNTTGYVSAQSSMLPHSSLTNKREDQKNEEKKQSALPKETQFDMLLLTSNHCHSSFPDNQVLNNSKLVFYQDYWVY